MELHKFELFDGRTLHTAFYTEVENCVALRESMQSLEIEVALMNARLIVDLFQIYTSASRALLSEQTNKLTTKTIHAELVFNLSGTRNVAESFRRFGLNETSDKVVLCIFDADADALARASTLVKGQLTPISELGKHLQPQDITQIKKYYKIQDLELKTTSLLDAVVSRIATKSCSK